jgi:hypothetical protein
MIYVDTAIVAINGLLLFRVWWVVFHKARRPASWSVAFLVFFVWPLSWVNLLLTLDWL